MKSENYFYASDDFAGDMTSYEEQLLLNYDDYLEGGFANNLTASGHYNLVLGDLEEDLEEDFDSEYDENDWEEEEPNEEESDKDPGTFIMKS
ncbi:hypothetical protein ASE40_16190 [Flavobacterium sp. Root935]|jgi:hypothetical protein|uniref:hypothetical protein n=1 Tax=unclassified Flavobacterium TaxID=196869 RepID=UPI00070C3FDC|nr:MULTISPECIES: hypothetical protein [unclassified Flavobacterium]KRD57893.1 hypothetical protein ASE40_16190 [Flavobacterium sp. Root935]MDQ1165501.1 hypothetical protein [Flavobacterium sp. SORGH_AS_0622]TDX10533.1 hypothetical protein EDB96_2943 [Flavobacterium sp. S87F.05.LMB.W.Kidney.N]